MNSKGRARASGMYGIGMGKGCGLIRDLWLKDKGVSAYNLHKRQRLSYFASNSF